MKKRGFTLSELLIALGIVAVTAAMVGPMFSSLIPDKNKMKVISYYNKINEINQKLLNASDLYTSKYEYDEDSKDFRKLIYFGFADDGVPLRYEGNSTNEWAYWGGNKYKSLFSEMLTGERTIETINLENGSQIEIVDQTWDKSVNPYLTTIFITFDIDGEDKGKNCSYDGNKCKKPDIFKFKVDESGNVTAGDAMTDAYLTTIGKSNSQKDDKELAKKYLEDDDRKANYY